MRIGFDAYTIEHRGLSVEDVLDFARARLEGVQFLEPASIAPDLDPARLAEVRAMAEARGLALDVGIPSPNPARDPAGRAGRSTPEEHADDLIRHDRAAAALGCRHARAYLGDRHDRFRTDVRWIDQLRRVPGRPETSGAGLTRTRGRRRDRDACGRHRRRDLELLDGFDPGVLGVTLDTGTCR